MLRKNSSFPFSLVAILLLALGSPAVAEPELGARGPEPGVKGTGAARSEARPPSAGKAKPEPTRRPSWGKVFGFVRDASTREPLTGVTVTVQDEGAFAREGKTVGTSDARGRFQARAPLGKMSSRLDIQRLLTTSWITLLIQPRSVTKQTRVIDLTQLHIRAEKPGYKPFLGAVRCARLDPGGFRVHLDDILLAPGSSALASFAPDNQQQEIIHEFKVEPAIARPGEKVTVTLRAELPVDRGATYRAFVDSASLKLIRPGTELRTEGKPEPRVAMRTFSRTFLLPERTKENATELTFFLLRDHEEVELEGDWKALLQVVNNDAERKAAAAVDAGFRLAAAGEQGQAVEKYREAVAAEPQYAPAHLYMGDTCLSLNRAEEAAGAFQQLIGLYPDDWEVAHPRYALALLQAGRAELAAKELSLAEKKTKRVPFQVYLYRARSAADLGDFAAADADLTRAGRKRRIPTEVQREINLKRAMAAVKEKPENVDAHLGLARALSDARRWEESALEIRRALALDPNQSWAHLELGAALRELGRQEEAEAAFVEALRLDPNNVEAHLAMADLCRVRRQYERALPHYQFVVDRRKANFEARHHLALMCYQAGRLDDAIAAFTEALRLARGKGDLQTGLEIPIGYSALYFGPKKRLVAGFADDRAELDYTLLDNLETIKKNPKCGLSWQSIGSALARLELPDLALDALAKAEALEPGMVETRYWAARSYRQLRRDGEARAAFETVLKANPLHPRAHLDLAQLLTEAGETEAAQAHVLTHARNWPHERKVASR